MIRFLLPMAAVVLLPAAVSLEKVFTPEQDFAFVLPQLDLLEGTGGLRAADCGTCHRTIYQEWRRATHAMAARCTGSAWDRRPIS